MTHWSFDNIILLAIFLNSILLALTDYSTLRLDVATSDDRYGLPDTRAGKSFRNSLQEALDPVFTYIFIAECAVKLISMGFWSHKNSYLRDNWNCLDFLIVLTSIVGLVDIGDLNMSAIRTFRVLRPLKTLSALPGLQVREELRRKCAVVRQLCVVVAYTVKTLAASLVTRSSS